MLRKLAKIIFPAGSLRRRLAARMARKLHIVTMPPPDIVYAEWVERSEPFLWSDYAEGELSYKPLISIVVPVFNAPARHLLPMVYSVVNQEGYDNWELILINASNKKSAIQLAQDCQDIDTRVRCINLSENRGIALNTNAGISHCKGEYVALLDHDDLLAPRALYEVAGVLQEPERPQLIYSDEDKVTDDGRYRFDAHFKPDWSPQLFRQVNYLNHLTVIEKKLIDEVGGYREGYEGAQDYDLFLRLVDKRPVIRHIPKVLYHWRAARTSTASDISTKKHVLGAGEKALGDHLSRNKQSGTVSAIEKQPGFYNIIYKCKPSTQVAVLLLPTDNLDQYTFLAKRILRSLKDTRLGVETIVGRTSGSLASKNTRITIKQFDTSGRREYLDKCTNEVKADAVIIFNSAAIPLETSWLEELVGLITEVKSIGVAAPFLVQPQPNKKIFDAGFISQSGQEVSLFKGVNFNKHTYSGNTMWSRNVDYLSGRVCAMRSDIFVKYFKEHFPDSAHSLSKSPYDKIRADGYEIATYSRVRMEYRGELSPQYDASKYLSGNLAVKEYDLELAKNINVPPPGGL